MIERETLVHILASLPEFVLFVDVTGTIQFMSRAEPGYEPSQFVGMNVSDLATLPGVEQWENALSQLLLTGDPQSYEARVELPDGFNGWYEIRLLPYVAEGGSDRVVVVGSNVTERKGLEARLEQLKSVLPICGWCDRIQDETDEWLSTEQFLEKQGGKPVSHGLCPPCAERQIAEIETPS